MKKYLLLLGGLLGGAALAVACVFNLGYRLPQPDAHPDWPEWPRLKTRHLVVEPIPDFEARYGRRYQLPRYYGVADSLPVTAVRVLGRRVMTNDFHVGATNGSSNSGVAIPYPPIGWRFNQYGDQYLEVSLDGEKGYFKQVYASHQPPLYYFHQYNQPATRHDTLLLRVVSDDYRVFVR